MLRIRQHYDLHSFYCYINLTLLLILLTFLQVHTSGSSLISKPKQYSTINFDPDFLTQEALKRDQQEGNTDEIFRNGSLENEESVEKYFIAQMNEHRGASYTKAVLAGMRDFKNATRKSIHLGFKKVEKVGVSENEESNDLNMKESNEKLFVCYYLVPAVSDMPYPVFPETIDPFLCTHILVAFARVQNGSVVPNKLGDYEFYNRTVNLKLKNPQLKVMLSVGSSNLNDAAGNEFVIMMNSSETRIKFIKQSLQVMKKFNFDGLDIDWEFPSWDGPLEQKQQYSQLFREYRTVLKEMGESAILSAAVPSPKQIVDLGYDIKGLSEALDFINLMTYDFHMYTWYTPLTGPNSPLFNTSFEFGYLSTLNTAWAANYWYQNGMPAHKIIVGIPTYGRSYTLIDHRSHDFYSLAGDIGKVGAGGYAQYGETCKFMENNGTLLVFNDEAKVPYTYRDKEWISFENEQSSKLKAQWVKENLFGGIMIWCINHDDAFKRCNTSATAFPIMRAAKMEFFSP